jgi:hypothetical protein
MWQQKSYLTHKVESPSVYLHTDIVQPRLPIVKSSRRLSVSNLHARGESSKDTARLVLLYGAVARVFKFLCAPAAREGRKEGGGRAPCSPAVMGVSGWTCHKEALFLYSQVKVPRWF